VSLFVHKLTFITRFNTAEPNNVKSDQLTRQNFPHVLFTSQNRGKKRLDTEKVRLFGGMSLSMGTCSTNRTWPPIPVFATCLQKIHTMPVSALEENLPMSRSPDYCPLIRSSLYTFPIIRQHFRLTFAFSLTMG
jgi:hypothetical protein